MEETAFLEAVDSIDWRGVDYYSSDHIKKKAVILRQELRFLGTFLEHTARRWPDDDENLQHILAGIEVVGRGLDKLNDICASKDTYVVGVILDNIEWLKPEIRNVLMDVLVSSRSLASNSMSEGLAVEFIESAWDHRMEVDRKLQIQVSELSASVLPAPRLIMFIDAIREDLKGLVFCEAELLEDSVKEEMKALERKLGIPRALVSLTAKRCNGHDRLKQLLAHVQAVVDVASCLATYCLTKEKDENKKHRLSLAFSDLVKKIDPFLNPQICEVYIGVLKGSTLSHSKSNILLMGCLCWIKLKYFMQS